MGVRTLKICVQVLNVDVEPDFAHINWEVQIITLFNDSTLCGVAMQDSYGDKIYTPSNKKSGGSSKRHGSNEASQALWAAVKKQWTIQDVTSLEKLKPDQVRIIDPNRGTCRLACHLRIRQYSPLDATLFPHDVHLLKLRFIPVLPRDLVMFDENPTLYLDGELKDGDISDAPIWRTWKIRYHDVNLEFTHPHHSFTSSAYHVLEISITIERKHGVALKTTYPVARMFHVLLWFTALVTDAGTTFLITSLLLYGVVYTFQCSDRPRVPYVTLFDKRLDHLLYWAIYPMVFMLFVFAVFEKIFEFAGAFERDFATFVVYGRLGSIVLAFIIYKLGECQWRSSLHAALQKNEYMLNIQKQTSISATIHEPDLPEDMSIFTLWESKQFLARKKTPVPESAINKMRMKRRPQSAPRGRGSSSPQKYSVYAPKDGNKKRRRNRDDPNLIYGPEGTEEFDVKGKHVYFEPQGNLQDNIMRDKLRGSTKGILLREYEKKPLNSKIPKAFLERMAKGPKIRDDDDDVEVDRN
jgi:hypothetical protein